MRTSLLRGIRDVVLTERPVPPPEAALSSASRDPAAVKVIVRPGE